VRKRWLDPLPSVCRILAPGFESSPRRKPGAHHSAARACNLSLSRANA
jgi:hypothetical protein